KGPEGLAALTRAFPGQEFVVLSTCNRVEVYAAGEESDGGDGDVAEPRLEAEALTGFLARFHGQSADSLAPDLVSYHDEGAVGHLFRVTASLESLVLGEGQILGQVRDAYKAAVAQRTAGPILHTVFQEALRVGKKVREATGMDRGKLSVA